jgi:hypothetical protein
MSSYTKFQFIHLNEHILQKTKDYDLHIVDGETEAQEGKKTNDPHGKTITVTYKCVDSSIFK